MSKIRIYGYKGCGTCKKAEAYLKERGVDYEEVDITTTPPKLSELKSMLKATGGKLKKLFNTSGVAYREQKLGDKLPDMSDDEALKMLAANGRLVKRPFLVVDGHPVTVGFDAAVWDDIV